MGPTLRVICNIIKHHPRKVERNRPQQRSNKSPINSAVEEQQKEDPNTTVVVVNNEASVDLVDATVLSIEDLDASAQEQTLPESTIACHHSH